MHGMRPKKRLWRGEERARTLLGKRHPRRVLPHARSAAVLRLTSIMSDELFEAIDQHDSKRVETLLSAGADPNAALSRPPQWTPLGAAIEELEFGGPVAAVRLLVTHGADVNQPYVGTKLTPLHAAMFSENIEVIELLLDAGANPNALSDEDRSPLRFAVERDALSMAALLLRHGASATINDSGGFCGETALGMAARKANVAMIQLLLEAGASVTAKDSDGRTALDHLPPRSTLDSQTWNVAMELLVGLKR